MWKSRLGYKIVNLKLEWNTSKILQRFQTEVKKNILLRSTQQL